MRSICYLRGYAGMGIGIDIDSLDFKDVVVVMPQSSEFCFPFLIMLLMFRLCLAFLSYPPLFILGGLFSLYSFALFTFLYIAHPQLLIFSFALILFLPNFFPLPAFIHTPYQDTPLLHLSLVLKCCIHIQTFELMLSICCVSGKVGWSLFYSYLCWYLTFMFCYLNFSYFIFPRWAFWFLFWYFVVDWKVSGAPFCHFFSQSFCESDITFLYNFSVNSVFSSLLIFEFTFISIHVSTDYSYPFSSQYFNLFNCSSGYCYAWFSTYHPVKAHWFLILTSQQIIVPFLIIHYQSFLAPGFVFDKPSCLFNI